MNELIEMMKKYNLTIKGISEKYEIPYNTIRQWVNGSRKMPKYLFKLIEKNEKNIDK